MRLKINNNNNIFKIANVLMAMECDGCGFGPLANA
jgi:Na+-translocating ferredoxin:NAD+ oxidoreductase RNF subunit RnfB